MTSLPELPRMYGEFAGWFHLLTPPEDYKVEAAFYSELLVGSARGPVEAVLELGSGGGNNASHMKERFRLTLVDLSHDMLELSRSINPECEHIAGDMRTLRLDRTFDGVFVHDAVTYMTTESDLVEVMETAYAHCRSGGSVVFAPDCVTETFAPTTDHGGSDGDDGRGLRYLEWTWDPSSDDDTYVTDFAYLVRYPDGVVKVAHDRHICGLFDRDTWLRLLTGSGFEATRHDGIPDETGQDVFVGIKP